MELTQGLYEARQQPYDDRKCNSHAAHYVGSASVRGANPTPFVQSTAVSDKSLRSPWQRGLVVCVCCPSIRIYVLDNVA